MSNRPRLAALATGMALRHPRTVTRAMWSAVARAMVDIVTGRRQLHV